jgi:hypothetical protein
MIHDRHDRLPISTRHAFALAFDLGVRRDPLHSLLVPFVLHAPWILALARLQPVGDAEPSRKAMLLAVAAGLGEFLTFVTITAMLRFRARSVFNTPGGVHPAGIGECYARGLRRVPWLFVTEALRNLALFASGFFFVVPGVYLGYRLAFATEAVVLNEATTSGAFQRSFRYSRRRFERWVELVAGSGAIVVALIFAAAALSVAFPAAGVPTWIGVMYFMIAAVTPIIQYAWTFFYLRLVEIDPEAIGIEVGPTYTLLPATPGPPAAPPDPGLPPRLTLVGPPEPGEADSDRAV